MYVYVCYIYMLDYNQKIHPTHVNKSNTVTQEKKW